MNNNLTLQKLSRKTGVYLKRHSSTILTCVGGIGVVATAVTAAKATPKAIRLLEEAENNKGEELTKMEKVKVAGPAYIPSVLIGATTVACIFSANILNKRQQAAITSAYALLDRTFTEYKEKVAELYGEGADILVREKMARDHYEKVDVELSDDEDTRLFYDQFAQRYFESTLYNVQRAEYAINRDLHLRDYVTLNEFYSHIGIDTIPAGEAMGWSVGRIMESSWNAWIDFDHEHVVMEDGLECIIVVMRTEPSYDYNEY